MDCRQSAGETQCRSGKSKRRPLIGLSFSKFFLGGSQPRPFSGPFEPLEFRQRSRQDVFVERGEPGLQFYLTPYCFVERLHRSRIGGACGHVDTRRLNRFISGAKSLLCLRTLLIEDPLARPRVRERRPNFS